MVSRVRVKKSKDTQTHTHTTTHTYTQFGNLWHTDVLLTMCSCLDKVRVTKAEELFIPIYLQFVRDYQTKPGHLTVLVFKLNVAHITEKSDSQYEITFPCKDCEC